TGCAKSKTSSAEFESTSHIQAPNQARQLARIFFSAHEEAVRKPKRIANAGFRDRAGLHPAATTTIQRVPIQRMGVERSDGNAGRLQSLAEFVAGDSETVRVDPAQQQVPCIDPRLIRNGLQPQTRHIGQLGPQQRGVAHAQTDLLRQTLQLRNQYGGLQSRHPRIRPESVMMEPASADSAALVTD